MADDHLKNVTNGHPDDLGILTATNKLSGDTWHVIKYVEGGNLEWLQNKDLACKIKRSQAVNILTGTHNSDFSYSFSLEVEHQEPTKIVFNPDKYKNQGVF